ncbi:MAG: hypothetical protein DRN78_05690 [Thermoproteota archaeon]|nr:MAG: hypothetical protein DRN78_05690 [Candidatus Korarchaeota archaeon]
MRVTTFNYPYYWRRRLIRASREELRDSVNYMTKIVKEEKVFRGTLIVPEDDRTTLIDLTLMNLMLEPWDGGIVISGEVYIRYTCDGNFMPPAIRGRTFRDVDVVYSPREDKTYVKQRVITLKEVSVRSGEVEGKIKELLEEARNYKKLC